MDGTNTGASLPAVLECEAEAAEDVDGSETEL